MNREQMPDLTRFLENKFDDMVHCGPNLAQCLFKYHG